MCFAFKSKIPLGFPGDTEVKDLPASARDTRDEVQSLDWEEMTTHCSILAWEIPWTEEPGVLQAMGLQRVRHD